MPHVLQKPSTPQADTNFFIQCPPSTSSVKKLPVSCHLLKELWFTSLKNANLDWTVALLLPQIHVKALIPNVTVFGDGTYTEVFNKG